MFARHDLAWLTEEGWEAVRLHALPAHFRAINQWCEAGWPATVRRQDADTFPDQICLGITSPRSLADEPRVRINLRCLKRHVERTSRPLDLHAVDEAVSGQWKAGWQAFKAVVAVEQLNIRVYGSLAMQVLTGQAYLTEQSDIDLLFIPSSLTQLKAGTDMLARHQESLPLDGEVLFPSGRAVAWKEWRQASLPGGHGRVLAKGLNAISLRTTGELLAELQGTSCMR